MPRPNPCLAIDWASNITVANVTSEGSESRDRDAKCRTNLECALTHLFTIDPPHSPFCRDGKDCTWVPVSHAFRDNLYRFDPPYCRPPLTAVYRKGNDK